MWTLDFGCVGVRYWLYMYRRWILVERMLDFGCLDVGFGLIGRWILVVWTLAFSWVDVGSWLFRN